jgi:hypothetical protein
MNNKGTVAIKGLIWTFILVFVVIAVIIGIYMWGNSATNWIRIHLFGYNETTITTENVEILGYNINSDTVEYYDGIRWILLKDRTKIGDKTFDYNTVHNDFTTGYYYNNQRGISSRTIPLGNLPLEGYITTIKKDDDGFYKRGEVLIDLKPKNHYGERFRIATKEKIGSNQHDVTYFRFINDMWEWTPLVQSGANPPQKWYPINSDVLAPNYFDRFSGQFSQEYREYYNAYFGYKITDEIKNIIVSLLGKNLESGKAILLLPGSETNSFIISCPFSSITSISSAETKFEGEWKWRPLGSSEWKDLDQLSITVFKENNWETYSANECLQNKLKELKGKSFESGKEALLLTYSDPSAPEIPQGRFILRLDSNLDYQKRRFNSDFGTYGELENARVPATSVNEIRNIISPIKTTAIIWRDSVLEAPITIHFTNEQGHPDSEQYCPDFIEVGLVVHLDKPSSSCKN